MPGEYVEQDRFCEKRAIELLFLKPSTTRVDTFDGFVYEPRIGS